MKNKVCSGSKPDGSKCAASAMEGSDFCFFHDPSKSEERLEAQSLGGRGNRIKTLSEDTPDVKITSGEDIVLLLSITISQARRGEIDLRTATVVGYLASIARAALEQSCVEKRLHDLEAVHKSRLAGLAGVES